MEQPLVSVIMGTFNRVKYLREAIDGVLAQTYPNLEFIVVDDASTDGTVAFLESYGPRLRLLRRTQNSGTCGVTKNDGMRVARGKYFAFQDSDDEWYPDKVAKQVAFMEAHPEVPLCHTYCEVIDSQSRTLRIRHEGRLPSTGRQFSNLLRHCYITIGTVMVRRELINEIGGFAEDPEWGREAEDLHFFLRVARKYPLGLVPEILARYRVGGVGSMAADKGWKSCPRVPFIMRRYLQHPETWQGTVPRREMIAAVTDAFLENTQYWRHRGYSGRALFFVKEALRSAPLDGRLWNEGLKSLVRCAMRGVRPKGT